jgi:hypothetical protein
VGSESKAVMHSANTEYRENFVHRPKYEGYDKPAVLAHESTTELMTLLSDDSLKVPVTSEYKDQFVDYSGVDVPPSFPLAKSKEQQDDAVEVLPPPVPLDSTNNETRIRPSRFKTEYADNFIAFPAKKSKAASEKMAPEVTPTMKVDMESSASLLNTSPKSGLESIKLLDDSESKDRRKNPLYVSESHGQYSWPANMKLQSKRGRDYIGKNASNLGKSKCKLFSSLLCNCSLTMAA